jgi:hypothetical protein
MTSSSITRPALRRVCPTPSNVPGLEGNEREMKRDEERRRK